MVSHLRPLSTADRRPIHVSADDVHRFSGKRPVLSGYRLEPVTDPGRQYELAMALDVDGDDDGEEVNPFYGIPFGVAMLMARDERGDPAGFITFRDDLSDMGVDAMGRRRAGYVFKVFVFMVRDDLRGQGYGTALAVGALTAMREDLEALSRPDGGAAAPVVALRFVGEGKSDGGLRLLDRVARDVGILSDEVGRLHGLSFSHVATEVLSGDAVVGSVLG